MADKYKKDNKGDEVWGVRTAEKKGTMQGFKEFLWNGERGEIMGRTGMSWAKIGLFYLIYYAFLVGFWVAMLIVFYQTVDPQVPKWIGSKGLIGSSPGLGFRPKPSGDSVESTLIWFKGSEQSWKVWRDNLEEFMEPYEINKESSGEYVTICDDETERSPKDKACFFEIKDLGDWCHKNKRYGYDVNQPCIMLKLNKIYDWFPEYYKNVSDLPSNLPEGLVKQMQSEAKPDGELPKRVWVWCEGENPADKENIGKLTYFPAAGFDSKYYPYMKVPGYKSPLVAVKFDKPKAGVLMNIECKAWAGNIKHNRMDRLGMVHFELLID